MHVRPGTVKGSQILNISFRNIKKGHPKLETRLYDFWPISSNGGAGEWGLYDFRSDLSSKKSN